MLVEAFIWSCAVNAALSLAMGGFLLSSSPATRLKSCWIAVSFATAVWSAGQATMASASHYETAYRAAIIANGASLAIPVFLYFTVVSLTGLKFPGFQWVLLTSTVVTQVLNATGHIYDVAPIAPFSFYTQAQSAYPLYVIHLLATFSVSGYLLLKAANTPDPRRRKQMLLLFWGTEISFLAGLTTIPLEIGLPIFPWGLPVIPLYVISVGYAILRYEFFELKVALRRASVGLLIYALSAVVLAPLMWPTLSSLRNSQPDIVLSCIVVGALSAAFFASGPLIYVLLTAKSERLRIFLSSGLSHDLRSPLAAIQSASEILKSLMASPDIDRQRVHAYLDMIDRNANRLRLFSNDMIELIRTSESVGPERRTKIALRELTDEVLHLLRPNIESSGVSVHVTLDEKTTPLANSHALQSVLLNLFSNAIRFSPNGRIHFETSLKGQEIHFSMEDNGAGLEPGEEKRIFDRFHRIAGPNGGAGLGLTIAKGWIEAHGGRIWAESPGVGKGTKISFTLPADAKT